MAADCADLECNGHEEAKCRSLDDMCECASVMDRCNPGLVSFFEGPCCGLQGDPKESHIFGAKRHPFGS